MKQYRSPTSKNVTLCSPFVLRSFSYRSPIVLLSSFYRPSIVLLSSFYRSSIVKRKQYGNDTG